jgi:SnoaL-like domain
MIFLVNFYLSKTITMTTQEVADRFYELAKEGRFDTIQSDLFATNAVSIEPPHAASQGLQNASGLDAIKKKGEDFNSMVEEMHGGYTSKPVVGGNFFSVGMGMDVTMKGAGRTKMDEIAVYEVKDGKIVKEQFFY